MKKQKLYFSKLEEDYTRTINHILEEMKEREITEIQVCEAERELNSNYFFCKAVGEVGEKGNDFDSCGKGCKTYKPRNGKSGCCKHRGFCYVPGKEYKLLIDGKLTQIMP